MQIITPSNITPDVQINILTVHPKENKHNTKEKTTFSRKTL